MARDWRASSCIIRPVATLLLQDIAMRAFLFFALPAFFLGSLFPLPTPAADEAPYDLLIKNGKIVDGTGNPWYYGTVAIRGSKIVGLGKVAPAAAKREIDAKGLIVSPGFVDMHSHSDFTLLEDGNAQSKIRQGVTTEALGESSS